MDGKLKALKTLGFNYITRNMDGKLCAWMVEPQRSIYCTKDKADDARKTYGEDTIIDCFESKDECKSRYIIGCCSFVFSRKIDYKDLWDYGWLQLYDPNNEFKDITWENSPFEIP